MAVITKIEVQKRSKERFNIYIDKGQGEEYGFSVNEVILIKHGLQKGLEIDEIALGNILYNEEVQKAYLQAISYLSYQMRTKLEIEDFLRKKKLDKPSSLRSFRNYYMTDILMIKSMLFYIRERKVM
ncbi:hypothetical protein bcere0013_4530 [Bacillus cereus BDRD-ST26]|nr:hypothetical protein bcere0013_4530 [Bacillus cereus BDRD-ST26]